jgi:5'(3')-deoxyribonucleotidase
MRIGIDLDNVTYPFVEQLHPYAEHKLQRRLLPAVKWDFFEDWGIDGKEFGELMREAHDENGLWRIGTPLYGALTVLEWLQIGGHDICFVTNRPEYAQQTTIDWLSHWHIPTDEVWFEQDKSVAEVDVMLDDAPHVYEQMPDKTVLFNRKWNEHVVDAPRAFGWQSFYRQVQRLNRVVQG